MTATIPTVTDNLRTFAEALKVLLARFLLEHSKLYLWNTPDSPVFDLSGKYAFRELDDSGRQLQSKLLNDYDHFSALVRSMSTRLTRDSDTDFRQADRTLRHAIEHRHTWSRNTREVYTSCLEALEAQLGLLNRLYDSSGGDPIYVPDTNALLYNVDLSRWYFDGVERFTVLLLPTVLAELDLLKVNSRADTVRDKSEQLIRMFKEYRGRGSLADGVPIVKGRSTLRSVASEPRSESFLPWLDNSNNDDRFIASVLEGMQTHPRSPVIIVTRDINLQNKAEYARLPFAEPPGPGHDTRSQPIVE